MRHIALIGGVMMSLWGAPRAGAATTNLPAPVVFAVGIDSNGVFVGRSTNVPSANGIARTGDVALVQAALAAVSNLLHAADTNEAAARSEADGANSNHAAFVAAEAAAAGTGYAARVAADAGAAVSGYVGEAARDLTNLVAGTTNVPPLQRVVEAGPTSTLPITLGCLTDTNDPDFWQIWPGDTNSAALTFIAAFNDELRPTVLVTNRIFLCFDGRLVVDRGMGVGTYRRIPTVNFGLTGDAVLQPALDEVAEGLINRIANTTNLFGLSRAFDAGDFDGDETISPYSVNARRFGWVAGAGATGDAWGAFGYQAGCNAKGDNWHAFGQAGQYAIHTNSQSIGRFAGRTARGNTRLYIDVYATDPAFPEGGATNDAVFLDNGQLHLGRVGPLTNAAPNQLRGEWRYKGEDLALASHTHSSLCLTNTWLDGSGNTQEVVVINGLIAAWATNGVPLP